jgi:hypothetical protein
MSADLDKAEREAVDEMANVLYDHFNPDKFWAINVRKDVCLDMAEIAFKLLRERSLARTS